MVWSATEMASQQASAAARLALVELPPCVLPAGPSKLDRLRQLRAVIDSLRSECEAHDPLVAWILEREKKELS
jgi:hypothetical protein